MTDVAKVYQIRKVFDPQTMGTRDEIVETGDADVADVTPSADVPAEEPADHKSDKTKTGTVAKVKAKAKAVTGKRSKAKKKD